MSFVRDQDKIPKNIKFDAKIKIVGAPHCQKSMKGELPILETIDASEEDSFSLETFGHLILEAYAEKKDFLMARVLTSDPKEPGRSYASYYPAFPINKIIFRRATDRHTLYRLRARNPLNNMSIVGNVYYYAISYMEVEQALQEYCHERIVGDIKKTSQVRGPHSEIDLTKISKEDGYFLRTHKKSYSDGSVCSTLVDDKADWINPIRNQATVSAFVRSPIQKRIKVPSKEGDLFFKARFFATDYDFMESAVVREYFIKNAVNTEDISLYSLSVSLASNNPEPSTYAPYAATALRHSFRKHISAATIVVIVLTVAILFIFAPLDLSIILVVPIVCFIAAFSLICLAIEKELHQSTVLARNTTTGNEQIASTTLPTPPANAMQMV